MKILWLEVASKDFSVTEKADLFLSLQVLVYYMTY